MGTINYKTSDYITMGIKPLGSYDLKHDREFMDMITADAEEYGGTIEEAISNYINDCLECDYENIEHELKKYSFDYYRISIEYGYYEGFSLNIENNCPVCLDNYEDRRLANKEITEIKQLLINCAGLGLVACSPGWCTGYKDYNGTIKAIKAAIKEMRAEIKATPTWRQYEKSPCTSAN